MSKILSSLLLTSTLLFSVEYEIKISEIEKLPKTMLINNCLSEFDGNYVYLNDSCYKEENEEDFIKLSIYNENKRDYFNMVMFTYDYDITFDVIVKNLILKHLRADFKISEIEYEVDRYLAQNKDIIQDMLVYITENKNNITTFIESEVYKNIIRMKETIKQRIFSSRVSGYNEDNISIKGIEPVNNTLDYVVIDQDRSVIYKDTVTSTKQIKSKVSYPLAIIITDKTNKEYFVYTKYASYDNYFDLKNERTYMIDFILDEIEGYCDDVNTDNKNQCNEMMKRTKEQTIKYLENITIPRTITKVEEKIKYLKSFL